MKWYSATQRGLQHNVHCEDAALVKQIGKNRWLAAVIDGDSNGQESHFASTLFAKILRRMGNEFQYYEESDHSERSLKELQVVALMLLMEELEAFKDLLHLENQELMSTLVLLMVDSKACEAEIIVIGQGMVAIDGKVHCFQYNKKPDYLIYHLKDNFGSWYDAQTQRISIEKFSDITIATDGVYSFQLPEEKSVCDEAFLQDFLFRNKDGEDSATMMEDKLHRLEKEHKVLHKDDIALVRVLVN